MLPRGWLLGLLVLGGAACGAEGAPPRGVTTAPEMVAAPGGAGGAGVESPPAAAGEGDGGAQQLLSPLPDAPTGAGGERSDVGSAGGEPADGGSAGAADAADAASPPEPVAHAILYSGQSNCAGTMIGSIPDGIPTSSVRYWVRLINTTTDSGAFGDLAPESDLKHGAELQLGVDLVARGLAVAIVKICRNSTTIGHFLPGTPGGDPFFAELAQAKAALPAEFPGRRIAWHWVQYIGETDARAETDTGAQAWGESFDVIRGVIEAIVGPVAPVIVRTHAETGKAPWLNVVRAEQESRAATLVDVDDLPLVSQLHLTGPAQNTLGARLATLPEFAD